MPESKELFAGLRWSIVQGLAMSDFAKEKMEATGKELCEERDEALAVCRAWIIAV